MILGVGCLIFSVVSFVKGRSLSDFEFVVNDLLNGSKKYDSISRFIDISQIITFVLLGITVAILLGNIIYNKVKGKKMYKPLLAVIPAVLCVISSIGGLVFDYKSIDNYNKVLDNWKFQNQVQYLCGMKDDLDPDGDEDNDGLTNAEEEKYSTDPYLADTDGDSLSDKDEIELGTDPLSEDTDGDGISDGAEVLNKLDPKKRSTDGKVSDSKVTFDGSYKDSDSKVNSTLSWKNADANMTMSFLQKVTDVNIQSNPGIYSEAYKVNAKGKYDVLKISFKSEDAKGECAVYEYRNGKLKALKTVKDDDGNLSADVIADRVYVFGASAVSEDYPTVISFVIDNSGSMYDKFMADENSKGNDNSGKRFDMVKNIAHELGTEKYSYNLYTFLGSVTTECKDVDKLSELDDKLKNTNEPKSKSDLDGTNIGDAVEKATEDLSDSGLKRKIIVVLTDGADNSFFSDLEETGRNARDNKIAVIGIGLGNDVDKQLPEMVSAASGETFYAKDANCLDDVVEKIKATIDSNTSDDRTLVADCGFLPDKNGFNFQNYTTAQSEGGHCYGMATFARLYYMNKLPDSFKGSSSQGFTIYRLYSPSFELGNSEIYQYYNDGKDLYSWNSDYGIDLSSYTEVYDYNNIKDGLLAYKQSVRKQILEKNGVITKKETSRDDVDYTEYEEYTIEPQVIDNNKLLKYAPGSDRPYVYENMYESIRKNSQAYKDDKKGTWETYMALYSMFSWQYRSEAKKIDMDTYENVDTLEARVNTGDPVVIILDHRHAVNLCRIEQDKNDTNKYYYMIYDNNFPGQMKQLTVTIKPLGKVNIDNLGQYILGEDCVTSFTYDYDSDNEVDMSGSISYANEIENEYFG